MPVALANLTGLIAFARVAELRSFAEAARQLDLSPSSVSKSVARLETRLGAKLLHRSTRSVSLTAEGEELLGSCAHLLAELQGVEAAFAERRRQPSGPLRVSMSPVVGRLFLVPLLPRFLGRYPEVKLELMFDDRRVDLARDGVDVVIRAGELPDAGGLITRHLFARPMVVVGAPAYLAARGRPETLEDLARHNCLLFRNPDTGRLYPWRFVVDGREVAIPVEGNFVADDGEAVFDAALAGIGLTQTLVFMAAPHLAAGRLVRVLEGHMGHVMPMSVCFRERRLLAPKVRAFVDFLAGVASEVPSI